MGDATEAAERWARTMADAGIELVPLAPDQEYRNVQREMAAEWLKLADAVLHPPKRII